MTRAEFTVAFRAARVSLKTMVYPTGYGQKTRYTDCTPDQRRAAEAAWIVEANNPSTAPASRSSLPGTPTPDEPG